MLAYDLTPLSALMHLLAGLVVLFLPGLTWVAWFAPPGKDPVQSLADAAGLSLALTAMIGLAAFQLDQSLSAGFVGALYVALGALALTGLGRRFWRRRTEARAPVEVSVVADGAGGARLLWFALALGILGLALVWRLYQVRDLALPAWVDSLHHVLIVRLVLEKGGLPQNFEPYMPVPFYYHFAFHLVAAAYTLLSRLEPAMATLLIGQALNALVALSVYRLGMAIWGDWRRAGVAALLVAFFTQMPAYYATWGRYTLLAGLALLPLAMAAVIGIARQGGNAERVARLALLTAGLLLAHYFAALLLGLFALVQVALLVLSDSRREDTAQIAGVEDQSGAENSSNPHPSQLGSPAPSIPEGEQSVLAPFHKGEGYRYALLPLLAGVGIGLLLALPWLGRVWEYARAYTRVRAVLPNQSLDAIFFTDYLSYLWYLMGPNRNVLLLALAGAGLFLRGWRREARPLTLWTAGLLVLALPWGLQLRPFRPDHAVIVLFLPAVLYVGDGLVAVWERLQSGRLRLAGAALALAALAGLLVWGVRETRQVINPVTVIAQEGDLPALAWVQENVSPEARFYINVALWQRDLYRGVDGGWWILPLTGRETIVPPTMYQLGEADYVTEVNATAAKAAGFDSCTPELGEFLHVAEIGYVYLGVTPGALTAAALEDCAYVEPVYNREGVNIYRVLR